VHRKTERGKREREKKGHGWGAKPKPMPAQAAVSEFHSQGGLNNMCSFLTVMGTGCSRSGCLKGWFLLRTSSWAY
jgi:hypothetical protein